MIRQAWNKVKAFFSKPEVPQAPVITPDKPSLWITVKANGKVIGAVQSLSVIEKKDDPVIKVQAQRVRFDRAKLEEVLEKNSSGVTLIRGDNQKVPLQIDLGTKDTVSCSLHNLKVDVPDYTYQTDDWVIVDSLDMTTEAIDKKT